MQILWVGSMKLSPFIRAVQHALIHWAGSSEQVLIRGSRGGKRRREVPTLDPEDGLERESEWPRVLGLGGRWESPPWP